MGQKTTYRFPFSSYPAVRILFFLIAGIIVSSATTIALSRWTLLWFLTLCIWIGIEWIGRKKYPVFGAHLSGILYMLLLSLVGGILHSSTSVALGKTIDIKNKLNLYSWENIRIKGSIKDKGISANGRDVYKIWVDETQLPQGDQYHHKYLLRIFNDKSESLENPSGSKIVMNVTLYSFPERRNIHEFDYGEWLLKNGFSGHGEIIKIIEQKPPTGLSWSYIREGIQHNVDTIFDEKVAPLAKALLLGYKQELHADTKVHFARSGLSHIMAVSGLHVGFIIAPFWLLIPFLWRSKYGKWFGLIGVTILLVGYAGITGFSASVSRAALMAWFLTYGKLFHKLRNSVNLTAVAAIIILMIQPNQLFDVGFQLSFSAVFIILLVMPHAQMIIPQKYRFGVIGGGLTIMLVSVVVQIGIFPILVYYFGEFAVAGPIANTLVLPFLTIVVPVGLLLSIVGPVAINVVQTVATPIGFMLNWIEFVANSLGSRTGSFISVQQVSVVVFFIWALLIGTIASIRIPRIRWKMVVGLLCMINLFLIERILEKSGANNMVVTFLDVGQGDAIHIKTPGGKHILIDAGRWSPMGNSGERVLLPYFEHKGINELDAVLLSHPHADHIGGMPDLLQQIDIQSIYESDLSYESELYKTMHQYVVEKDISVYQPKAGEIIDIDPAIRIFVIGPEKETSGSGNPNNRSLAFKLVYGETSMLFTGDAEEKQEKEIAGRYGNFLKSDLYKIGHHSSNTSSNIDLLEVAMPEISVASLAFRNVFGHPGSDAIKRLTNIGTDLRFTSLTGSIVYESNGKDFIDSDWRYK